jgi:HEAT repeat protein
MTEDMKPAAPAAPAKKENAKPATPPPLDERRLRFEELAPHRAALDIATLVAALHDGRALVRANAALALAAAGQPATELATQLRDSDPTAALAAADAITRLGASARALVPGIVQALDSAQPDVAERAVAALSQLAAGGDLELIAALDVPFELAMKSVIAACALLGPAGVALLAKATRHDAIRIRVNAAGGLGKLGKADVTTSVAALTPLEAGDPVPDVRTAAKQAILAVVAREKVVAVDALPKNIPDFEARKLSMSELAEHEANIAVDEMLYALHDGRNHVRINGARSLAVKGDKAVRAARALGLVLRDGIAAVRREAAKALAKLGPGAIDAAPDLCGALGDADPEVAEAAAETLEGWGTVAASALVRGLETESEQGGRAVGRLIAKLPNASALLVEAFRSPAVNTQVYAALGLGQLGKARIGDGLATLLGARTGYDARTCAAVREALDQIEPRRATGPKAVAVDGFEARVLTAAELDKQKAELAAAGTADLVQHLHDGRDVVRANAATALGMLGAQAAGSERALGVLLRDDSARVRLAAARALDRLGDAAVIETADDLVRALGDAEAPVAEAIAAVIRARKARMIGALVRGLETDQAEHGRRIVELLGVFDDAVDILCEAFESPAVNVQVNAALGLGLLGAKRVGKGRRVLEGARTGGWERTRGAVRKAIELLDGPRRTGPAPVAVDGFEARYLDAAAFGDATKLVVDDLAAYLADGRSVVRANAATALGCVGAAARGHAVAVAVLLRDDDPRVRIAAAGALDKLGDDAVRETGDYLVGALRGDAEVAKAVAPVLVARKARVLTALIKGLETDDEPHGRRILEVINALPDAGEILLDAIESPAENVQVNAALGIGMLGAKRAGAAGRRALEGRRTGGFVRTREAAFRGLAMLDG